MVKYNKRKRKTSDAESGICFSYAINEQADCEAGERVLKARACEYKRYNKLICVRKR